MLFLWSAKIHQMSFCDVKVEKEEGNNNNKWYFYACQGFMVKWLYI